MLNSMQSSSCSRVVVLVGGQIVNFIIVLIEVQAALVAEALRDILDLSRVLLLRKRSISAGSSGSTKVLGPSVPQIRSIGIAN